MKKVSVLAMLLFIATFGFFVFAEEGTPKKPISKVKFTGKQLMEKYAPQILMVKDGFVEPAEAEGEAGEEAPPPPPVRRNYMSEGWRMGYMISDTIVMYPFNMMLRQMKKKNIDPAEELRVTIALPDGTEVPGLEIGMNIEMTLAFAVVVIPEGVVVKKTDFSKKFIIHIEDKVFLIAKRAEEWEFCPFYLPSEINGELKFKKEKYFSVERSSQQLTTEALGSLVVRENGELLGLIVRKDGKRYSAVIENLSAFAEAVDIAINRPEELKEYEDLPEPRRRPGAPGRMAPVFGMGG